MRRAASLLTGRSEPMGCRLQRRSDEVSASLSSVITADLSARKGVHGSDACKEPQGVPKPRLALWVC